MAAEYPNLLVVLVLVGISVVLGGVSWGCGEIATRMGCIVPRNFVDKILDGFLIFSGIGVNFLLIAGLICIIKEICTCIKSCQLPLTEKEIEKLQLLYVTDYWEYVHTQLSYSFLGEKYCLHGAMERIEEPFVEQLVKMLEKELQEADTDYLKRLENLESEYIFKNIATSIGYIAQRLENVGKDVAKKLEMDTVYTELLPDGKVKKVEELLKQKSEQGKVVFAGDGINDAPVLTLADIGIAMGGLGSDAAVEAADIVIMTDEPSKIVNAIKISKKTMRIVKENIIFAIFVKIAVLVLSAIGMATMWEAVFADVGVSIIAIINALRVLKN